MTFESQRVVATFLLVAYSVVYAFANTELIWFFPPLYYAKHIVILVAALCALLWRNSFIGPSRDISLISGFYLLSLLVTTMGDWSSTIQAAAFFLACSFFAIAFQRPYSALPLILTATLLGIPLLRNEILYGGNLVNTTLYGRERLLLGYFHPKEAANAVLACSLVFFALLDQHKLLRALLILAFCLLLSFVQSRNGLLFIALFLVMNTLYQRLGLRSLVLLALAALVALGVVFVTFDSELYDAFSSGRLRLWQTALDFPENYLPRERTDLPMLSQQFNVDNFYLETYLRGGITGLFATFAFLVLVLVLCHGRVNRDVNALPLLLALCISSMFDAGLTSTGNILHIFVWSIAISCWREVAIPEVAILVSHPRSPTARPYGVDSTASDRAL